MNKPSVTAKTAAYVVFGLTTALIIRSWLQVHLRDGGMDRIVAADLSFLIVPLVIFLLLFPLWTSERGFLSSLFRRKALTLDIALRAVAIGFLARVLWWAHLVAGGSFGWFSSNNPDAIVGPQFSFGCAAPEIVLLGFFVMAVVTPIIEEVAHRGYVQTALYRYGTTPAVLLSSAIFTVFHVYDTWPIVFLMGIVFGLQFKMTNSLWAPTISHATYNGLIQVDWRCISTQWSPPVETLPLLLPGSISVFVFLFAAAALIFLLKGHRIEAP